MSKKEEIWKDIDGYEGIYQVSNMGQVRSCDRYVSIRNNHKRLIKGILLRQRKNARHGYCDVKLCLNSIYHTVMVHKLVANAFLNCCDKSLEINHIDGNKQNNAVYNLEFVTRKENIHHAIRIGLTKIGAESCRAVYSKSEINLMRTMWKSGVKRSEICLKFKISASRLSSILLNKRYKDDQWGAEIKSPQFACMFRKVLTKEIAVAVRRSYMSGIKWNDIISQFKISQTQMLKIIRNEIFPDHNYIYKSRKCKN